MAAEAAVSSDPPPAEFEAPRPVGSEHGTGRAGEVVAGSRRSDWRMWTGRDDGNADYQFGDLTRGLTKGVVSKFETGVRDWKHAATNCYLDVKGDVQTRATEFLDGLASSPGPCENEEEVSDMPAVQAVTASSGATSPEAWWHEVCQISHKNHREEDDPPSLAELEPDQRGHLKVEVLTVGTEVPLTRADGAKAVLPVCQLWLDGCYTGALRPADRDPSARGDATASRACFAVREVAKCDLRVQLFDRKSHSFTMGFEDKGFCGGAFLPLELLARNGGTAAAIPSSAAELATGVGRRALVELENVRSGRRFESLMTLTLLPLQLVRTRTKLEPANLSAAERPKTQHGHIMLRLTLTLRQPLPSLAFAEPVHSLAEYPASGTDPRTVLKFAGTAVARSGQALKRPAEQFSAALEDLRSTPLTAVVLYTWWSFVALQAPVWQWPTLVALALPLVMRRASQIASGDPPLLYVDEAESTDKDCSNMEKARKAVKDAVKMQFNITQVSERLTDAASHLEKAHFIATASGEPWLMGVCALIVLAISVGVSVALWLALVLLELGALRYLAWFGGCYALLPSSGRVAVAAAVSWLEALRRQVMGDKRKRQFLCFWQRIPDAIEACHLILCERYILAEGRQAAIVKSPRPL